MQNLFCLLATFLAAYAPFTERGQVDFDTVLQTFADKGTWIKTNDGYAFLPNVSEKNSNWLPFREGRWTYSDRGWMFEASNFESWITTHYGYWKREQGKWCWIPQGYWLPSTVAWISSGEYIGWRAIKMGPLGEILGDIDLEKMPAEEWTFIPISKFSTPMKAGDFATLEQAKELLKKAQPSYHKIKVWREVEYSGPAPSDVSSATGKEIKTRILKTLPEFNAQHPEELPDEYYLYRPKFFQDNDGIQKRIEIFIKKSRGENVDTAKTRAVIGLNELEGNTSTNNTASTTTPSPTIETNSTTEKSQQETSKPSDNTTPDQVKLKKTGKRLKD